MPDLAATCGALKLGGGVPGGGGGGGGSRRQLNGGPCQTTTSSKAALTVAVMEAAARADAAEAGCGNGTSRPDPAALLTFTYSLPRATFTMGQEVRMVPQQQHHLPIPLQFRLLAPLPQGLQLDEASGAITGAPTAATPSSSTVVEAVLLGGRRMRATVDIEVVDFTRGGYVIGHIRELEPGTFMLLLHMPGENSDVDGGGREERGCVRPLLEQKSSGLPGSPRGGAHAVIDQRNGGGRSQVGQQQLQHWQPLQQQQPHRQPVPQQSQRLPHLSDQSWW